MKEKILVLLLTLALLGSMSPAALADGEVFADVPAGIWFEQGVTTCARDGIMIGVGGGRFAPDDKLTSAECLTLALRLYDLRRGGTGELERAPEDWGSITFTLSDGTTVEGTQNDPFGFSSFIRDGDLDAHLYFYLEPEQEAWGKSMDAQTATVTADGKTYAGTARCWDPTGNGRWVISFYPDAAGDNAELRAFYRAPHPDVTEWYRHTAYTAEVWGLNNEERWPGFWELGRDLGPHSQGPDAVRYQFANALAEAAGELPRLYEVKELPDLKRDIDYGAVWPERVFALYEAGILTGTDEYGTFESFETLTRAQAAVMVARVLDDSQRITTPPAGSAA